MAGKADLVDLVVQSDDNLTKKQAAGMVDALFDGITDILASGDRVQVPGFGSFSVSERAARTGRNPKTGETMQIPASRAARFKAGKALKEALNS